MKDHLVCSPQTGAVQPCGPCRLQSFALLLLEPLLQMLMLPSYMNLQQDITELKVNADSTHSQGLQSCPRN